ncbi:MAG: response regulator [Proteobacteria bacterium]|nr:response regulator [Pseudomonadota bacterium]
MAIDANGTVFVGSLGEFGFLASDISGELTYVSLIDRIQDKDKEFNDVWNTVATSEGVFFVTDNKIFKWHNQEMKVIPVSRSRLIFSIFDKLFVVQANKGIFLLHDERLRFLPYCEGIHRTKYGMIVILPYDNRRLLIVTQKKGSFLYDYKMLFNKTSGLLDFSKARIPSSIIERIPTEIDAYVRHNQLYSGARIDNKRYAISTLGGGIAIIDNNGKLLQIINKNRGLQSNQVFYVYVDNHKNLWAGLNSGISHIEIGSPITQFTELNGVEEGVLSLIRHNGRIHIASSNGVYYLPDYKLHAENDNHRFLPVKNIREYCLGFFSHGNELLAACRGVHRIWGTVGKRIGDDNKYILSFGESKKFPNIVFMGMDTGLGYFELRKKEEISDGDGIDPIKDSPDTEIEIFQRNRIQDLDGDLIYKMVSDNNGDLWLTSIKKGIIHVRFNGQDISDTEVVRYNKEHGLPQLENNYVHYINKELVIGTSKGVYEVLIPDNVKSNPEGIRFAPKKSFEIINDKSIGVRDISRDSDKRIWIDSDIGVGTLTKGEDDTYSWDTTPFKKIKGKEKSIFAEQNRIVWIGSSKTLYRYDPKIKKNYKTEYYTLIRGVKTKDGKNIFKGTYFDSSSKMGEYFTDRTLIQPKQLIKRIDYNNNSVVFEYSATFYEGGSANQFKYILEGFDEKWSDWSEKTDKEYTNLPEGKYKFKVKARNVFEHESSESIYEFEILSPWYRTAWAYLSYVFFFILFSYSGIKLNTKRVVAAKVKHIELKKKKAEKFASALEIKVEDRTQELKEVNQKLEKANESLRDLDKMKSRFFANISHELRTPLTLILAPVESLLSGDQGEMAPEHLEQITGVRNSAMRLLKHIEDLLDLSRLEDARLRLRVEKYDLRAHIIRIIDFARPLAERKQIEIVFNSKEDLFITADEAKLERVFVNLVSNALKFTDSGGKISIRADKTNEAVNVAVEDNGIGIAEEDQERIFDRFGQVEQSITRRKGGSGIGLSLAKELVELHCGRLTLTSEPGKGSTFSVEFPTKLDEIIPPNLVERRNEVPKTPFRRRDSDKGLTEWTDEILSSPEYRFMGIDKSVERRVAIRPQAVELKSARLLVVDDNPEVLTYLQQSLRDRYDIWTAQDGKEAWESLLAHRHDLVVADVRMPEMSGIQLTHRIKEDPRVQDTPVILLTARGGPEHRVEGLAVGADQYFTKPFNPSELRAAIKNLLASRNRRMEVGARRRSISMETLLGGMAHELHNACYQVQNAQTAVWSLARRIDQETAEFRPESHRKVTQRLDQMEDISGRALKRITKVVRSLEHYTRNQMQMPWITLDLAKLVEREVQLITTAQQKGVGIELSLEFGIAVRGPEEEVRQMVINMVENAIDAVESGGLVEVKTASLSGKVQLEISDNGCGIPADKQEQVFDPFYTTKDPGKGMGLGLSLCKRTVDDLGGEIELRSEKGIGTRILVELPSARLSVAKPMLPETETD